ncbi:MAG: choice-of-anchor D domain-containing protein, partial [Acidobacteriaceae bacterium]|nr:choice-of-anchor D domain-containing protein [Acidobacteriaceae bacterium]
CTVTLSYTELATASDSATLSIANNTASTPTTVALTGSAAIPTVSLSATTLTFTSVTMGSGTTTSTATVTLTNNGTVPLSLSGTAITGTNANLFSVSQTSCGTTLAVAGNCTVTLTFAPTQGGTYSATLSIADNTSAGSEIVGLSSTAIGSGVTLSSNAVTFTSIVAGISNTTTATVTLQNTGTTALTLSGIAMSGTNANAFTQTNTCGTTVAASTSCVITMKFAPLVSGSYVATMTLTDNAGTGTQTVSLTAAATPFVITLNNSSSTWVIDNGAITFKWSASSGNLISWILDGYADQLIDTAYSSDGLYMDNAGFGTGSNVNAKATWGPNNSYLDWQITNASSSTNAYSATEHWIVYPNDPGVHVYIELVHATTDIAGSVGQVQWVFRDNTSLLPNTYEVNPSLTGLGVEDITLPSQSDLGSSAAGRSVENAVEDLHGFNNFPSNWTREFYTKYDFAGYEYLHQAHGVYGPNYGVWTVLNNKDTFVGGPTKQNLFFTENIDMIEAFSDHEDEPLTTLATAAGVASTRLFGPYYIHVNRFGKAYTQTENTIATQADMYADAMAAGAALAPLYDNDTVLTSSGYVVSTARGSVSINMSGIPSGSSPYTAWAVLSDPGVNFQVSSLGYQYWADISANGTATITGVVPGTYRISVYVLGQWGEFRQDGVIVTANGTTTFTGTWVPENFAGTNETTVFTIGTPDRSAHEFLHGHTADGKDDRENLGAWNYWADFAANNGAAVYYATAVGSTPATNDLSKWNYNHWGYFDPGLYAGVYGTGSDVSTDGYIYAIPSYVAGLSTETGTNGVTTPIPAWQIHFATPANYTSYSSGYAVLSVAVACTEGSYVLYLNNHEEIWHYSHASDCQMRSGLSGYTQWFAMQWPVSDLIQSVGGDNLITISMSTQDGSSDDAFRMELTNTSAAPATRGWYDYSYIWGNGSSSYSYPNDAQANP